MVAQQLLCQHQSRMDHPLHPTSTPNSLVSFLKVTFQVYFSPFKVLVTRRHGKGTDVWQNPVHPARPSLDTPGSTRHSPYYDPTALYFPQLLTLPIPMAGQETSATFKDNLTCIWVPPSFLSEKGLKWILGSLRKGEPGFSPLAWCFLVLVKEQEKKKEVKRQL